MKKIQIFSSREVERRLKKIHQRIRIQLKHSSRPLVLIADVCTHTLNHASEVNLNTKRL